jgi:hypothetical protein
MMFTDGKTFTALTAMRFYMRGVSSPTIFSCAILLTAWTGAHFTTFRIGVLCDGNGIMLDKNNSRSLTISSQGPRAEAPGTVD